MMINEHLVGLYNVLIMTWKQYEKTEYQDCSITGDKIVIDDKVEYLPGFVQGKEYEKIYNSIIKMAKPENYKMMLMKK